MEKFASRHLRDMDIALWNRALAAAKIEGLTMRLKVAELLERYLCQIDNLTNSVSFQPARWWEIEREAAKRHISPADWVNETIALRLGEMYEKKGSN